MRCLPHHPTIRPAFPLALRVAVAAAALAACALAADSPFDSLVAAERGFARQSVEHGMRAAFLDHMAPDAVIFRPGPVNGVPVWTARKESPAVLDWAPSYAEVSGSGDLGFSTGPWSFAVARDSTPVAFGHFVTVWKRTGDGPWKFALDIGVSHDDPGVPPSGATLTAGPVHPAPDSLTMRKWDAGVGVTKGHTSVGVGTGGFGVGVGSGGFGVGMATGGSRNSPDAEWRRLRHETNRLLSAERTFAFEAKTKGWESAYRKSAAGDLRVYRDGHAPEIGAASAVQWNADVPTTRDWRGAGQGIARAADLGYAYGIVIAKAKSKGARPDTASYLHLWRKDDANEWRMMLELESPFPKR